MDEAARGASALSTGDFPLAITHYTKAIGSNPQAVDYYIKRSTAYTRISPTDPTSALKDSEIAVLLAVKRGKRELLAQSQLRRGIALFGLERWADAQECFSWVSKLDEKEKSLKIWGIKVEAKLKGLDENDDRRKATVKEIPDVEIPKEMEVKKIESTVAKTKSSIATTPEVKEIAKLEGVRTPADKIRHEWYQTTENVVVTLFAKGIPKDKATIEILQKSLSISFPLPTGSDFQFSLDPLYAKIDESASRSKVMSTKVEFTLKKLTNGQKWSSLESTELASDETVISKDGDSESLAMKRAILGDKPAESAPSYPTSSKSGPKNWDKLADDLTKKRKDKTDKKAQGDHGGDDDDGIDDYEGGDPVNGFFQQLYKGADPDTRRAMMKSYQESNGTALSTNWAEVGKGKVETSPPEGMEAKKWMP